MIPTLAELLQQSGSHVRCFDIGRRITELAPETWLDFEKSRIPYPYPMQQKAWIALVTSPCEDNAEPVIWFLQFPLDEQGKIVAGARDYLLKRLLENPDDGEAAARDNPFVFKPRDQQLANFHARLSQVLNRPPSRFYSHALDYFSGKPGWEQWKFVGYQGIADVAIQSEKDPEISQTLARHIADYPAQPLAALCLCLEHTRISALLTKALVNHLQRLLKLVSPDITLVTAMVRGLAGSHSPQLVIDVYRQVLENDAAHHIDILSAISARAWESLLHRPLALQWLEKLASNSAGTDGFNTCIRDILLLPGYRQPMLELLQGPECSEAVKLRFNHLQNQQQTNG